MSSLKDLVGTRYVTIRGVKIKVMGVSGRGLAELMSRFPEIAKMLTSKGSDRAVLLRSLAPNALAAVIAAGIGEAGEDTEKIADSLALDDQVIVLDEVLRATFPRGIRPFVETLTALGAEMQSQEQQSTKHSSKLSESSEDSDTEKPSTTPRSK